MRPSIAWTIGCAALVAHFISAFQFYHSWGHVSAYNETARQTAEVFRINWGGGLFINYAVAIFWTGDVAWWRRGDQLNLRWEKVDFQRNVIYVPNSKTGRDYTVPMNQDVRDELLALRRVAAKSECVFVNSATGKQFTEIKRAFQTACRLAGITNLRWHDLRHTFGTKLGDSKILD